MGTLKTSHGSVANRAVGGMVEALWADMVLFACLCSDQNHLKIANGAAMVKG
jgi:hypothetical protein